MRAEGSSAHLAEDAKLERIPPVSRSLRLQRSHWRSRFGILTAGRAVRLEWTKTLAKLMELYDQQLSAAKIFLHGHTGPGSENDEPGEQDNGAVLFERRFRSFLMEPWTVEHLNLTCHDCGSESQDVWERSLYKKSKSLGWDTEYLWLCSECYAKRVASQPTEEQLEEDEE